ncbi:MAG: hypothetical protein EAZ57_03360 [Cytophagales bacterium]|nr:MAG: hypothetical protein EAZ67_03825 [Cytophagales bacterium]TAF61501.1 MAG: hypothetical protein EAZ57_03360 [Cytophagales bacterium]
MLNEAKRLESKGFLLQAERLCNDLLRQLPKHTDLYNEARKMSIEIGSKLGNEKSKTKVERLLESPEHALQSKQIRITQIRELFKSPASAHLHVQIGELSKPLIRVDPKKKVPAANMHKSKERSSAKTTPLVVIQDTVMAEIVYIMGVLQSRDADFEANDPKNYWECYLDYSLRKETSDSYCTAERLYFVLATYHNRGITDKNRIKTRINNYLSKKNRNKQNAHFLNMLEELRLQIIHEQRFEGKVITVQERDSLENYYTKLASSNLEKIQPERLYLFGVMAVRDKQLDEGITLLEAVKNKINHDTLKYALADAYYKKGEYLSAAVLYEQLNLKPSSLALCKENLLRLAQCYDALGQEKIYFGFSALIQYSSALHTCSTFDPIDLDILHVVYKLFIKFGNYQEAENTCQKFLSKHDSILTAEQKLQVDELVANIWYKTKNYKAYTDYLQKRILLTRNNAQKVPYLYQYQKACVENAQIYFNQEDYLNAIAWYDYSLAQATSVPLMEDATYYKALAYYKLCDYVTSKSLLNKLVDPKNKGSRWYVLAMRPLAYIYFHEKKYKDADGYFEAYYNMSKTTDGSKEDALLKSGDCSFHLADYAQAKAEYKRVITSPYIKKSTKASVLLGLARCDYSMGNWPEALEYIQQYGKQQEEAGQKNDAIFLEAMILIKANRPEEALASLNTFISQAVEHEKYAEALYEKAKLCTENAKKISIDTYTQLITDYPSSPFADKALTQLELYRNQGVTVQMDIEQARMSILIAKNKASTIHQSELDKLYRDMHVLDPQLVLKRLDAMESVARTAHEKNRLDIIRAECLLKSRNYKRALEVADAVRRQNLKGDMRDKTLYLMAQISEKGGNAISALTYYDDLLKVTKEQTYIEKALIRRMIIYRENKQYQDAETIANIILKQSTPDGYDDAYLTLAGIYLSKDKSKAMAYFAKAAQHMPSSQTADLAIKGIIDLSLESKSPEKALEAISNYVTQCQHNNEAGAGLLLDIAEMLMLVVAQEKAIPAELSKKLDRDILSHAEKLCVNIIEKYEDFSALLYRAKDLKARIEKLQRN